MFGNGLGGGAREVGRVCEEWTLQQGPEGHQVPIPGMAQCCCSLHLSTFLLTAFYFPHALALPTSQKGVRLEGGQILNQVTELLYLPGLNL